MLNEEVVSSVAIGNLKAISEQPAMLSNLAYSNVVSSNNLGQQNAVANQQSISELGISLVAKGTNTVSDLGPMEARSSVDVLTNNELAQTIADMKATLQAFADPSTRNKRGFLARLKALLDHGIKVDEQGRIIIGPGGATVVFEGKYAKEDVQITLDNNAVVVKVIPLQR